MVAFGERLTGPLDEAEVGDVLRGRMAEGGRAAQQEIRLKFLAAAQRVVEALTASAMGTWWVAGRIEGAVGVW
jgi:hypothetical protein